jgi:hypothetical protein
MTVTEFFTERGNKDLIDSNAVRPDLQDADIYEISVSDLADLAELLDVTPAELMKELY